LVFFALGLVIRQRGSGLSRDRDADKQAASPAKHSSTTAPKSDIARSTPDQGFAREPDKNTIIAAKRNRLVNKLRSQSKEFNAVFAGLLKSHPGFILNETFLSRAGGLKFKDPQGNDLHVSNHFGLFTEPTWSPELYSSEVTSSISRKSGSEISLGADALDSIITDWSSTDTGFDDFREALTAIKADDLACSGEAFTAIQIRLLLHARLLAFTSDTEWPIRRKQELKDLLEPFASDVAQDQTLRAVADTNLVFFGVIPQTAIKERLQAAIGKGQSRYALALLVELSRATDAVPEGPLSKSVA
jgi:hypothetical protein